MNQDTFKDFISFDSKPIKAIIKKKLINFNMIE